MIILFMVSFAIVFSVCFLGRIYYLHTDTIEIITVSISMFKKLQSIYEFRQDMQDHIILNAPKMDAEGCVSAVMLTINKTNAEIKDIKNIIKKFEIEISNELHITENKLDGNIDKYL